VAVPAIIARYAHLPVVVVDYVAPRTDNHACVKLLVVAEIAGELYHVEVVGAFPRVAYIAIARVPQDRMALQAPRKRRRGVAGRQVVGCAGVAIQAWCGTRVFALRCMAEQALGFDDVDVVLRVLAGNTVGAVVARCAVDAVMCLKCMAVAALQYRSLVGPVHVRVAGAAWYPGGAMRVSA
jgi:hypothetical protein